MLQRVDHRPRTPAAGHRVILVREWDHQHTGSGCCGNLGGADAEVGAGSHSHSRDLMEQVGVVYRALRANFSGLEVEVVDPRNTAWLLPAVWRDARRSGAPWRQAWSAVRRATANGAIVVDGQVLSTGRPPPVDDVVAWVRDRIGPREP